MEMTDGNLKIANKQVPADKEGCLQRERREEGARSASPRSACALAAGAASLERRAAGRRPLGREPKIILFWVKK